jgi:hypothetical protein
MSKPIGDRGLRQYAKFKMRWHGVSRLQSSSIAFEGPCVWLFTELAYSNLPEVNPPALHLNKQDARRLRDGLSRWLKETEESV